MKPGTTHLDAEAESWSARVARAVTWFVILAGALSFWVLAGWVAWAYLES